MLDRPVIEKDSSLHEFPHCGPAGVSGMQGWRPEMEVYIKTCTYASLKLLFIWLV